MPQLSWNEIRQRAIQFSREWKGAHDERAEAQTFWNEFFNVFGIRRRTVASFEEPVRSLKNTYHRIDLFWKSRLLAEHKSAGESLDKASSQAFQYIQELTSSGRDDEVPRYVILSDFARLVLYDLEPADEGELFKGRDHDVVEIQLDELHRHVRHFAFITGQKTHKFGEEDPANIEAAQIMAELHDAIEVGGYSGHDLERLLVRLLFCLFADDTAIFELGQFELFLENHTREDGADLGQQLMALFDVLDTPATKRQKHLDEDLTAFPYINGDLFAERLPLAAFNKDMRNRLIGACRFDWSRISPAIFGSLFQGVMDAKERRQIGAHYTSERDILKVIRPLFLDSLHEEFDRINKDRSGRRKPRLLEFRQKLAKLKFLDPACGCGNFLVIAYRELRRLELAVITAYDPSASIDAGEEHKMSNIDVDQFHGIEIGEWPARIAETALWLTDHQMNIELSITFGNLYQRIPLRKTPNIHCGNALRYDWEKLLPSRECSYILGNPPFVGKHLMTAEQKHDVGIIWDKSLGAGTLDYVTCWYKKAAQYSAKNPRVSCCFVSTNSISQGEQVGYLWNQLLQMGMKILFAHRTFPWESEAKGKAHVHVVIIGFGHTDAPDKKIFEYHSDDDKPYVQVVSNINPYLIEARDFVILPRSVPLCDVPPTIYGNKPADGGNLVIEAEEMRHVTKTYPELFKYILPLISAQEFLHGQERYCLWLKDADLAPLRNHPYVKNRLKAVREFREASKKEPTRELAAFPHLFAEIRQPQSDYIVIPRHSSENRNYIPFGYFKPSTIIHDSCTALPDAKPFHFGVLSSAMHMAWVRPICGRIKSDFRYSSTLVYNNFPWPLEATQERQTKVEEHVRKLLDVRQGYLDQGQTLADLYDPLYMPEPLLKAHRALDRAVDRCYRRERFNTERERVEFLFALYEKLTAPLAPSAKVRGRRARLK